MINKNPERSKILVVDDIPLNRKLQKTYLESVGYQVIIAQDGVEALHRI